METPGGDFDTLTWMLAFRSFFWSGGDRFRGKPVAAIIDRDSFQGYQRFRNESQRPSMASLLEQMDALNREEQSLPNFLR